ncbi:MAG: hypothetical protein AAF211_05045 [Myxococcota bacterium]
MRPTLPGSVDPDVPDSFKHAAETVRAHLCTLRGGAPFLSSADAMQLMRWFEGGVTTTAILLALERAAESRRSRRSKVPLRLSHANRHLGRPTQGALPTMPLAADVATGLGPFAPVIAALPASAARDELATAIAGVVGAADAAFPAAPSHAHHAPEQELEALGDEGRAALRDSARDKLGDLLDQVDEGTAAALLDETVRDLHRARWPALTVATLWACVECR